MKDLKTIRENINAINDKIDAEKREATAEETIQLRKLEREYVNAKRENEEDLMTKQREAMQPKGKSLVSQLREAMQLNKRSIFVQSYTTGEGDSAVAHTGVDGDLIETNVKGLLEPLYAKSALAQLGVRWFKGLPQGDIQVPVMGAGSVAWASENGQAQAGDPSFTHVTLQPKRLTAYVDISRQLIVQDNVGAEEAIRRDLVNAINNKLEATIFGNAAGDSTKPAGMFYGTNAARDLSDGTTFANLCGIEAGLEAANVYGNVKYLLSPGSKADLRAMAKNGNGSATVFANGDVDGVPAVVTSNVATGKYIYGDFSCLAIGSWGNIEITIDEFTQATSGCVRLVVNAYFDAKILREAAFAFGRTRSL